MKTLNNIKKLNPMISICIPTYKREKFLKEGLNSILYQFKSSFVREKVEVIISDDNSPDNTEDMVQKYLKKYKNIRYYKNKKNIGSDPNIIKSATYAKGDYIWFFSVSPIRNFAIIAHIDHGKSTLADRFLELTGVVKVGNHVDQLLDRNPISRERGITIKLAPVRMLYELTSSRVNELKKELFNPLTRKLDNSFYVFNLIDTPGHVDFSYEVDRTLACVEGVILLVDATQGIQAQTISNAYKSLEKNLIIIPVINKIDLPNAEVEKTRSQLIDLLNVKENDIYLVSAKTGQGVKKLLEAVIEKIPAPSFEIASSPATGRDPRNDKIIQALIFDSYYDPHRGVIAFIRVFSGKMSKGIKVLLAVTNQIFEINEVGIFKPDLQPKNELLSGEIGYVVTNLKNIRQVRVGDTILNVGTSLDLSLPGYKKVKPMVFASIFTTDTKDFENLKKALERLYLSDSSLEFLPIYSKTLGAGFRVGFLGLLHADVVRERLEREFNLSLILTPPQVDFKIIDGTYLEPIVKILIITPKQYLGGIIKLCQDYRGKFITMDNVGKTHVYSLQTIYEMPMSEMISGFYDNLKSVSSGYASLDWELLRYDKVDADRLILLLNNDPVEEFSEIVVKERAFVKAQSLVKKLKEVIPRQQYEVRIQAKYKGKIIASERISPFRKDVTSKLYGGDRTRKDKLLEKQKEGKKKMKMVGSVEIPKEAFLKLFKHISN